MSLSSRAFRLHRVPASRATAALRDLDVHFWWQCYGRPPSRSVNGDRSAPKESLEQLGTVSQEPALGRRRDLSGPGLNHFLRLSQGPTAAVGNALPGGPAPEAVEGAAEPLVDGEGLAGGDPRRTVYLETYGCQMNVSDSQIVLSILAEHGYSEVGDAAAADVVLLNTCAIRENAESKIWSRLGALRSMKTKRPRDSRPTVGVLGCMAERLKAKLLESDKLVDLVVGPDAYRDLPRLLSSLRGSSDGRPTAMNVQLSLEETYADVMPVRREGSVSAYLSIMRGCNNLCAFCIVPFTRGRERSRDVASILQEVQALSESGVREVTLLGQNVNSYADRSHNGPRPSTAYPAENGDASFDNYYAKGFKSVYKPQRQGAVTFAQLLDLVAQVDPEMRIRFTSPHPKDFTDDVLHTISRHSNICSHLHMPAQSGSTAVLERMQRGYTRGAYDALIQRAREIIPTVSLSTDIIVGFCGETEDDHNATLDLMRRTAFDQAFMFSYSKRDKTYAARHYDDDVPEDVKQRRLSEVISIFREELENKNANEGGRRHIVLVEGLSKRGQEFLTGRTCSFKRVVFPNVALPSMEEPPLSKTSRQFQEPRSCAVSRLVPGEYVAVQVVSATAGTLTCVPIERTSIADFVDKYGSTTPTQVFQEARLLQEQLGSDMLSSGEKRTVSSQ